MREEGGSVGWMGGDTAARNALVKAQGGKMGLGGVGGGAGALQKALAGMKPLGPGPVMRPVIPPKGSPLRRIRTPVRFVVEKGPGGLR